MFFHSFEKKVCEYSIQDQYGSRFPKQDKVCSIFANSRFIESDFTCLSFYSSRF